MLGWHAAELFITINAFSALVGCVLAVIVVPLPEKTEGRGGDATYPRGPSQQIAELTFEPGTVGLQSPCSFHPMMVRAVGLRVLSVCRPGSLQDYGLRERSSL